MDKLLKALTLRLAKHMTRAGKPVIATDGDPLLVDAFKALGWDDPQPDPAPYEAAAAKARVDAAAEKAAKDAAAQAEKDKQADEAAAAELIKKDQKEASAATVRDVERAVEPRPRGRVTPVAKDKKHKGRRA